MNVVILLILLLNCIAIFSNITVMPLHLIPFRYLSNRGDIFNEGNLSTSLPDADTGGDDAYTSNGIVSSTGSYDDEIVMEKATSKILEPDRKPVKLTMRQGLILNQIIGTYALENAENELCRKHARDFKIGLRAFEPWALKSKC